METRVNLSLVRTRRRRLVRRADSCHAVRRKGSPRAPRVNGGGLPSSTGGRGVGACANLRTGAAWSIVPAGNIAAFVERLVSIAGDPGRRRGLVEAGRTRVRAYTTDVVAERTLQQLDLEPHSPVTHPPVAAAGASAESR